MAAVERRNARRMVSRDSWWRQAAKVWRDDAPGLLDASEAADAGRALFADRNLPSDLDLDLPPHDLDLPSHDLLESPMDLPIYYTRAEYIETVRTPHACMS